MGNAQTAGRRPRITQAVDESRLVRLAGNTRPEAISRNDLGLVEDSLRLDMFLQLKRSPEQELAAQQFVESLTDKGSPNYHQFISAAEFGRRFGVADEDIAAVSNWLRGRGFTVNAVPSNNLVIDFSGNAGQVRTALHTEIHYLQVAGERYYANMSDPQIPAALLPAVTGVVSMNNFKPHKMFKPRAQYTVDSSYQLVAPGDIATIYGLTSAFNAGYTGTGQTIAVVEDTDLYDVADWNTFRSTFGLDKYSAGSLTTVHPAGSSQSVCSAPGVSAGSGGTDVEAAADAEWATAAAPNATIVVAACADSSTNFGGFIALQNMLTNGGALPSVVSISYGAPESEDGSAFNAYINTLYQTAAAVGVSVFVSSGDAGAATSDAGSAFAIYGVNVSGWASTPYNVAVGGTDFADSYYNANRRFWSGTNNQYYSSALSYIPEIPWNDSCAGQVANAYAGYSATYGASTVCTDYPSLIDTVAAGGGPSGCATGTPTANGAVSGTCAGYTKPSWQASVYGNPSDGVRDLPDVSLFAADGFWGHYYVLCFTDLANSGAPCTGAPVNWSGGGGTSISAPIMAGIQALINQAMGSTGAGNPNPTYYQIATSEYGTSAGRTSCNSLNGPAAGCSFNDVTLGDIDLPCAGAFNCFLSGQALGVLSTDDSSYKPAYAAAAGWDFATGLGSVNAFSLLKAFAGSIAPSNLTIKVTDSGNFTQGQTATYTITVSSATAATSGAVNVTDILPSGLTLVSMTGTGWNCTSNVCSRSDVLAASSSYPAITVTVNVAASAASPLVNMAVVAGGGSAPASATDSANITVPCSYSLSSGGQWFAAAGGTGTITVTAGSGCAWTATAPTGSFATITSGASGSGNGTVAYSVAKNTGAVRSANFTVAGSSYTVQQASAGSASLPLAGSMAQIASGGVWNSAITLVNTGSTAAEVVVNFFDNNGNALPLPLVFPASSSTAATLAATIDQTIAPGAQLVIQTAGATTDAQAVGWAQLLATGGSSVGGNAVFAVTLNPQVTMQEAVVPLETRNPAKAFVMPFNYTNGYQTGVAVANLTNQAIDVPVTLVDSAGNQTVLSPLHLPAMGHWSDMLGKLYPAVAGYGTVEFGTTAGQISIVGIRATPALAITTVPVLAQ